MPTAASCNAALLRRHRVHTAVRELMGELGYRVSMDAVALRAGCSKQTLYADFGSKQELLRSMMQEHLGMAAAPLAASELGVREALLVFAEEHLARLSDPTVVAACQLLGAQSEQYPEEAQALYRDGCQAMQEHLAQWLLAAMQRGELRGDDPHLAAELLMSMIGGMDTDRQRLGVPFRDSAVLRRPWLEFAVGHFMHAFACEPALAEPPSSPRPRTGKNPTPAPDASPG